MNLLRIGREHINMNKKVILAILIFVGILTTLIFYQNSRNPEILKLSSGIEITAPITFKADENVTAIEVNIIGESVMVECISEDFEVIAHTENGCTIANFNGGSKEGVIGNVTFIQNENKNPLVSGVLGNALGNDAKNGVINIEY